MTGCGLWRARPSGCPGPRRPSTWWSARPRSITGRTSGPGWLSAPGCWRRRLPRPGRPVLGAAAADPAGRTAGQGAHQTAGSPPADGSGIARTAVAPPVRRHHPGSDGDEIAAAIQECRLVVRHLRDRFCQRGHLGPPGSTTPRAGRKCLMPAGPAARWRADGWPVRPGRPAVLGGSGRRGAGSRSCPGSGPGGIGRC